jgi:hypothetical protein
MPQIKHRMHVRANIKATFTIRYIVISFFATILLPTIAQSQCPSFVCTGQVIPPGCVITQIQTLLACGSGTNNEQILKPVQSDPLGAQETVCLASPIPLNWAIIDTPSILACGNNNPGNARTLVNLNGAPLNQLETVCNITDLNNLPGWKIIQTGIDIVPRCGSREPFHVGEQIQNTVAPPTGDFSLSVASGSVVVVEGTAVSVSVSITRTQGFSGNVTLNISGLPSGASASANPSSTTGNSTTVTITAGKTSPIGTFSTSITGSSGNLTHTTNLILGISPSWWPAIQQILQ